MDITKNKMRKFKLLKVFPRYDNIGKIYSFGDKNIMHPEKYPEFWQEVVEKDYEILSFKSIGYNFTWSITNDKLYCSEVINDKTWTQDELLKPFHKMYIHSVKRLSDGEIFTIGDKIQTSKVLTINSFIIIDNELLISPFEIIGTIGLNNFQKVKQPLFTTEDDVDIFEGDEYCTIEKDTLRYRIKEIAKKNSAGKNQDLLYYFSTKEKAEEYIIMNKPCLSLNDFNSLNETNEKALIGITLKKLKELVKTKLKQK